MLSELCSDLSGSDRCGPFQAPPLRDAQGAELGELSSHSGAGSPQQCRGESKPTQQENRFGVRLPPPRTQTAPDDCPQDGQKQQTQQQQQLLLRDEKRSTSLPSPPTSASSADSRPRHREAAPSCERTGHDVRRERRGQESTYKVS